MRYVRRMSNEAALAHLCAMEGVGIKTAACVLLFSLGRNVLPVDVHVHRVLKRVGLAFGSRSPEQTYSRMVPAIPPGKAYSLHLNLIRLGRSLCRPSSPRCPDCPALLLCSFASVPRGAGEDS
jgi:endonuclease-3